MFEKASCFFEDLEKVCYSQEISSGIFVLLKNSQNRIIDPE